MNRKETEDKKAGPNRTYNSLDFRMLNLLNLKHRMIRRTADETGSNFQAAEREIWRQMGQVFAGEPVTKSGGEE